MINFESRNISLCANREHQILYYVDGKITSSYKASFGGFFDNREKALCSYKIPTSALYDGKEYFDKKTIDLDCAIQADGHINKYKIVFSFRKEKKIQKLKEILQTYNLPYKLRKYKRKDGKQDTTFTINRSNYEPTLIDCKTKTFSSNIIHSKTETKKWFIEALQHWDYHAPTNSYFTTNFKNAEIVQAVFSLSGFSSNITKNKPIKNHKICYKVNKMKRKFSCLSNRVKGKYVEHYKLLKDNFKYCFSVPSTNFIIRRNNKIHVTGNCGHGESALYAKREGKNFVGIEINPDSMNGYILPYVQKAVNEHGDKNVNIKLILGDSSEFRKELVNKFDLCYTSPPYFNFEDYGFHNKVILDCIDYDEYHKRVTKPVFENVYKYLIDDGILALQTEKNKTLKQKWIDTILPIGFTLIQDTITGQEKIKYSQMSKRDQCLLIFKK